MYDGSSVESEFYRFEVGEMFYFLCVWETFRVGVAETVDVFPYREFFRVEAVGEDGGGEVGTFSSECRCGLWRSRTCDESLSYIHRSVMFVVELVDAKSDVVPFRVSSAEVMVGDDIFAGVEQFILYSAFVEVSGNQCC